MNNQKNKILGEAIRYFESGWVPIPLHRASKKPLIAWKLYQQNPPSRERIKKWWTKWPKASIGIVTGQASGIVAICVEDPEWRKFIDKEGHTPEIKLPGERRYFFEFFPGFETLRPRDKNLSVVVKTNGDYIPVPSFCDRSGGVWVKGRTPYEIDPVPLKKWVAENLKNTLTQSKEPAEIGTSLKWDDVNANILNSPEIVKHMESSVPGDKEDHDRELCQMCIEGGIIDDRELFLIISHNSHGKARSAKDSHKYITDLIRSCKKEFGFPEAKLISDEKYLLTTLEELFTTAPELKYLIEDLIYEGTVSILGGYTGMGKSLVCLSIAGAILTGSPLWGKFPIKKSGPVILIDEENPWQILKDRARKFGFDGKLPLHLLKQNFRIDEPENLDKLLRNIKAIKPVMVIVDSLIRIHGKRENDASEMSEVMGSLRKIAESGTSVLVIHHFNKGDSPADQRMRGSTDILGAVDVAYALTGHHDENGKYLVLETVKSRFKPMEPIQLRIESDKNKIGISYQGPQPEKEEKVLQEVVNFLKQNNKEAGVDEILKALKEKGMVPAKNKFRKMLAKADGKELVERTGPRNKKFYSINPVFQFHSSKRESETVKLSGKNERRIREDSSSVEDAEGEV
jgi:RecA-family ATPase